MNISNFFFFFFEKMWARNHLPQQLAPGEGKAIDEEQRGDSEVSPNSHEPSSLLKAVVQI